MSITIVIGNYQFMGMLHEDGVAAFAIIWGQRRSSVAGLTEDDRQTVDKERQVGDPMQLRTEVLNL